MVTPMRHVSSSVLAFALLTPVTLQAAPEGGESELDELRTRVAMLEQLVEARSVAGHRLPDRVGLLGQRFPLELSDVRERMEREFYVALADRATLVLWQKRAGAAFPVIERALKKAGAPDDLKYVAVIESGLKPKARSYAGAVGTWQFMPETARDHGLQIVKGVDRRRDLQESTDAAIKYLTGLRKRFGCWFLALAAYNAGQGRVSRALASQGVTSYWDASLPDEAERYVARVAAAKLVLSDSKRFGVEVPADQRFSEGDVRRVRVKTSAELDVLDLARAADTTYRDLRSLNPWITERALPAGSHAFVVPAAGAKGFRSHVEAVSSRVAEVRQRADRARQKRKKQVKVVRHRVRSGESLWDLASKYDVTVAELTKRNGLRDKNVIHPGQLLVVR